MSNPSNESSEVKNRVCDFYLSSRGCVKGDECDHLHPLAPNGSKTNRVCDYFGSPRGCAKGAECGFLHPVRLNPLGDECTRVCDFFLTRDGCVKGNQCDFLHPRAVPTNKIREFQQKNFSQQRFGSATVRNDAVIIGGERVCEYYLTPDGCSLGGECKFLHPRGKEAQDALKAKEFVMNQAKESRRGGNSTRVCQFFSTADGCTKGDQCKFLHERKPAGRSRKAADENNDESASHQAAPCKFFKSAAGCKKGEQCDFTHAQ